MLGSAPRSHATGAFGPLRSPLIAVLIVTVWLIAGCTVADTHEPAASTRSTVAGRSKLAVSLAAPAYRNLPVRALITAAPNTQVVIKDKGAHTLTKALTDVNGRTTATWTWKSIGIHSLTFATSHHSGNTEIRVRRPNPSRTAATPTGDIRGTFEAGGQTQFLDCAGSGGPTVVLIAGAWGYSQDWNNQVQSLRADGRVCTYDRPSLGDSPDRVGSTDVDAGLHAEELNSLLKAAGEIGPFEIVGHSYGGLIAAALAAAHPRRTAGVVLLDPVPVGFSRIWPEFNKTLDEGSPRTVIDLTRSDAAATAGNPLTGMPLIVVSAGAAPSWLSPDGFVKWQQVQFDQTAGCANCLHWIAEGATHQLQETAPTIASRAITMVRTSLRNHKPLKR